MCLCAQEIRLKYSRCMWWGEKRPLTRDPERNLGGLETGVWGIELLVRSLGFTLSSLKYLL